MSLCRRIVKCVRVQFMKSNEVIKFIFAKINDNVKYYSNMKQGKICQIVLSQAMFRKKNIYV